MTKPQDFGAVGDGETDDTQAFQEALAHARETDGILLIPPGNYILRNTLNLDEDREDDTA